jgi:hypothetical protein
MRLGRALPLVALLLVTAALGARADIRPRLLPEGGLPPEIDRRWWIEVGTSSPAGTGHTGFYQTGLLTGGGLEFPITRGSVFTVGLRGGIWPLTGSVLPSDTLTGGSAYFAGLVFGARNHVDIGSSAYSVVFGIDLGPALLHFGKIDDRAGGLSQRLPAERGFGTVFGLSLGGEYRPEDAIGLLWRFDEEWFSTSTTSTCSNVEIGLTRPW